MLKKIFSGICTILLLVLISITSLVFITRNILTEETVNNIINIFATNDNETINTGDIKVEEEKETTIVDKILNEILDDTTIPNELIDYIDSKKVSNYLNNYIQQYMEYNLGMAELPLLNTKEFNKIIDNGIKKYEKKTGNDINDEEIKNIITKIDSKVEKSELPSNKYTETGKKAIRLCLDDRTLYLLTGLIIINIIIILILAKLRSTVRRIAIILIINSIILTAISLALTFLGTNEVVNSLLKVIIDKLNNYAYVSFGIGVTLYVIITIIKQKRIIKEKPQKEEKNNKVKVIVDKKTEEDNFFTQEIVIEKPEKKEEKKTTKTKKENQKK